MALRKYSARTQSLYVWMIDDSPYFDRFPCLSNPPGLDSFFPNLRTIAWFPDDHLAMLPFLRLLCGPTLTSLSAEFATDPVSLAMVAALGILCPNITDISISASSETLSEDLANALSTSICHWKDLRHVSCDDLTISAMEHLSQVRNLESLTAYASGRMSSFSQSLGVQELSFPRLQYLHLYTGLLSTTATCFRGLRLALKEFRLDLFDTEEVFSAGPSCLRDLFIALAEACSHACLTKLYLYVIYPHFPSQNSVATIRDIRPLLSFTNLRVVSLEGLSTFAFDDDDIAELASTWSLHRRARALDICRSSRCVPADLPITHPPGPLLPQTKGALARRRHDEVDHTIPLRGWVRRALRHSGRTLPRKLPD
ncbi:hypothetical protein J3R83DRAFT_3883 [Lanmaoa asiatica]|nr:hypothetical protein J3R83DRAFT_3883 [Lanmaoa asiatica]